MNPHVLPHSRPFVTWEGVFFGQSRFRTAASNAPAEGLSARFSC
jgi:hypothetical protein